MWTYEQKTGRLRDANGKTVAFGYAGNGEGKNNPDMQNVPNIGPLPQGIYAMVSMSLSTPKHGPYVIFLNPDKSNEMFGRSLFRVHGDKVGAPGTASEGCIIVGRLVREALWESNDHTIKVVHG
jgi:hypothetical protein